MTNQEKMDLLVRVFTVIFQSKAANTDITQSYIQNPHIANNVAGFAGRCSGRWFVNNTLRGFDIDVRTSVRVLPLRCLEQNPNKRDNMGNLTWSAALVQQGHQLMWVIDRSPGGEFLGRLQKDAGQEQIVWHKAFEPATKPAVPGDQGVYTQPLANSDFHSTPEYEADLDAAYAHIDKDYNDPNFHGIPGTSGTSMAHLPIEAAAVIPPNRPQPSVVALPEPIDLNELPELPPEVDIPDYILEAVAEMDEPPDWGEDYD